MTDTDIDRFIRDQRSKLASDKRELNEDESYQIPTRRKWDEPNKDYFNFTDQQEPEERPETPAHQGYPVDNRQVVKKRQELSLDRKKEYNEFLKKHSNNRRARKNLTPTETSIKVGDYDIKRKEDLNQERRKDYNDLMIQSGSPVDFYPTDTYGEASLPIGQFEEQRKAQAHENKRQYRDELDKQLKQKEAIINKQYEQQSNKAEIVKNDKRLKDDRFKKQLRVQGSPRKSFEKSDYAVHPLNKGPRYPRVDYHVNTFEDLNRRKERHDFKTRDDYEKWQRRQLEELNDIERRQLDLKIKLERDLTINELKKDVDIISNEIEEANLPANILMERNDNVSPRLDPSLYDLDYAEYLRQSGKNRAGGVLIDETNSQNKDKLRKERQQEYNELMSQSPGIYNPIVTIKNQENKENLGYFQADSSDIHRQKLSEERKQEYNNMTLNKSSPTRESSRRMWTEDSNLDFFSMNRPEPQRQQPDRFAEFTKPVSKSDQYGYIPSQMEKSSVQQPAKFSSDGHKNVDEERRKEYKDILKSKSSTRTRRYNEDVNDEFMSNKYDTPRRKQIDKMEEFLKSGPTSPRKTVPQQNNAKQTPATTSFPNIDNDRKEEYNNLLKNSNKGRQKKVYREPSKDDFFDFGRIERNNKTEKLPKERAPINEDRRREYNENMKQKAKPKLRPFRENSSDEFLKYGGPQRRINNNENRVISSETFVDQEKKYQAKIKEAQTPRRRTWREPSQDDFYIGSTKYQKAPKKVNPGSYLLA